MALAGGYLDMRRAIDVVVSVILLLWDIASYGKIRGVCLKTD
jgi:hypothetical protein